MGVNVAVTANAAEAANPARGAVFFFSFVLVILAPRARRRPARRA